MNEKNKNLHRRAAIITGWVFIAVTAFFFLGSLIARDRTFSDKENRMLEQAPGINGDRSYPADMRRSSRRISLISSCCGICGLR